MIQYHDDLYAGGDVATCCHTIYGACIRALA